MNAFRTLLEYFTAMVAGRRKELKQDDLFKKIELDEDVAFDESAEESDFLAELPGDIGTGDDI